MRVIPLTSLLSHKGRGSRSPNRLDTSSLEVKKLFKHTLREGAVTPLNSPYEPVPQTLFQKQGWSPKLVTAEDGGGRDGLPFGAL